MSLDNDFIKVKSSDPKLQNKIHVKITDSREKIYWYIKFNLKLDEASVNNKNMFVTDRDGYVLKTEITYRVAKNLIIITPLEDYIEGVYYILNITKEVRSENLNNLKNDVHILFKINENRVDDFIILPANVVVPEPIFRKKRDVKKKKNTSNTKVYSFNRYIDGTEIGDRLPMAEMRFNPLIGALGIFLTFISLFINIPIVIGICGAIALVGLIHIIYQLTRPTFRSDFAYNKGVKYFNNDEIRKADKYFDKAIRINPKNEYAEYAKSKMNYYKE